MWKKEKRIYGLFVVCCLFFMTGCKKEAAFEESFETVEEVQTETEEAKEKLADGEEVQEAIFVYVCGEVLAPGVYELPADGRVYEAVEAAGGMTDAAAAAYLNQAEKLADGQKIYVPSKEEALAENKAEAAVSKENGKVNLNTATKEELMTLSGIGEVKAEAILRYRKEQGGFSSVDELQKIEGIKEGVFRKIKEQICI